jgi:hypothetical protein
MPEPKFQTGTLVLFRPKKEVSEEPSKSNAGRIGVIRTIYRRPKGNSYDVKFGNGLWDEVCAPEDELVPQ